MTRIATLFVLILMSGCAARTEQRQDAFAADLEPPVEYAPSAAGALVFDSAFEGASVPIDLDLSRDARQAQAFLGYDEGVTEYYSVRTDDRQREGHYWNDRYERRAVSVKVGVRYR